MKRWIIDLVAIVFISSAIVLHGQWSSGPISLPTGALILKITGGCPQGTIENSSLNGNTFVGTITANGNVGTTGGSDNITPTGTIGALTFVGNALPTHSHELPFQIPTTTTTRQLAPAIFGTGTSRVATGVSAAGVGNLTSAPVALTQSVTGGTPSGTIVSPSFTGFQFDNRSVFTRVIVCSVN